MDENEQIIKKYSEYRLKVDRVRPSTVQHQESILLKFSRELKKPLKKVKEKDIITFLDKYSPNSKDIVITMLRRFYRWLFNLEPDDKLPPCIRRIKLRNKREKARMGEEIDYRERIITPDEYQTLIDTATTIEHKAILETLYLFGVRVSELISMNATDVHETDELTIITIRKSKTIARDIPIKENPQYLLEWFNVYQSFKGQKDKPLWASYNGRSKDCRLTRIGIYEIVTGMVKKSGLKRKITTHDFRHTAITRDLSKGMPETHIKTKYGLTKDTIQLKTYDHNKTKDLVNYLTEIPTEKPKTYNALKKQKDKLEKELRKEVVNLRTELEKKTEIDNFIIESLSVIAKETMQNQGVEAIKEIFRKHNIPLVGD